MAGPFNTQSDYYNAASQYAVPSPESLDRAAARLRARTDTTTRANQQQITDQYAGRGTASSGAYNQQLMQNMAAGQNAFSQGYGQLQDDYVKQQQAGAGILSNIGTQLGDQSLQGRGLDIQQLLGQGNLDVQREKISSDDALQRYLNQQNLGFNREQLAQQGQLTREQLAQEKGLTEEQLGQQKDQALRSALLQFFGQMGQYGNTEYTNPGQQGNANELQRLIVQSLGGQYTPPTPPPPPPSSAGTGTAPVGMSASR
jgi:hypothetical protein